MSSCRKLLSKPLESNVLPTLMYCGCLRSILHACFCFSRNRSIVTTLLPNAYTRVPPRSRHTLIIKIECVGQAGGVARCFWFGSGAEAHRRRARVVGSAQEDGRQRQVSAHQWKRRRVGWGRCQMPLAWAESDVGGSDEAATLRP